MSVAVSGRPELDSKEINTEGSFLMLQLTSKCFTPHPQKDYTQVTMS